MCELDEFYFSVRLVWPIPSYSSFPIRPPAAAYPLTSRDVAIR